MPAHDVPAELAPATHELRCWPALFEPVWSGAKPFDIRYDDRGFQRGDRVTIREYDRSGCCCPGDGHAGEAIPPGCRGWTGRMVRAVIGFVAAHAPVAGGRGAIGNGLVVFSLVDIEQVHIESARHGIAAVASSGGSP